MVTMTCNFCGASASGTVTDALAWDASHAQTCPEKAAAA